MYQLVITTTSSKEEAKNIASSVVSQKLAACVQIQKIESIYEWNGAICDEEEYMLYIKSKKEYFASIQRAIEAIHSYEVPEIIALDLADASEGYARWMEKVLN